MQGIEKCFDPISVHFVLSDISIQKQEFLTKLSLFQTYIIEYEQIRVFFCFKCDLFQKTLFLLIKLSIY